MRKILSLSTRTAATNEMHGRITIFNGMLCSGAFISSYDMSYVDNSADITNEILEVYVTI